MKKLFLVAVAVLFASLSTACADMHASTVHVYEKSKSPELVYQIMASSDEGITEPAFVEYEAVISRNPHLAASLNAPEFNSLGMPACTLRLEGQVKVIELQKAIDAARELIERRYRESVDLGERCKNLDALPSAESAPK